MEPVTNEYANEMLKKALAAGDMEEVKKWELAIRGNNDMRLRAREFMREVRERGYIVRVNIES